MTAFYLFEADDPRAQQPDESVWKLAIAPEDESIHCIATSADSRATFTSWGASDAAGAKIEVTLVPIIRSVRTFRRDGEVPDAGEDWALLFFNPVIEKEWTKRIPVNVVEKGLVPKMMEPLAGGYDLLSVMNTGVNTFGKVNLVLSVPESFARTGLLSFSRVEPPSGQTSSNGREMTDGELQPYSEDAPPGFQTIGWTGGPVKPGEVFGIGITYLAATNLRVLDPSSQRA